MSQLDVVTLAKHVRAILVDQQAATPATGDTALDAALRSLVEQLRSGQPLDLFPMLYWNVLPASAPIRPR